MKVAVFSTQPYDQQFLEAEGSSHEWVFFANHLRAATVPLAEGCDAVCAFVNDDLSSDCLEKLHEHGIKLIALRCAGFNNVDLEKAKELGITVLRVPEYSPYAVAEHTLALLLALNRHIHKAYPRVRDGNFSLSGLMGFDLHGKTVGVIGVGKIGRVFCDLLCGFGVKILAYDPTVEVGTEKDGLEFASLDTIYAQSDVISLHCPLTPETHHLIDAESLAKCKDGLYLINTSRGGLVDADAAIQSLKSHKLGGLALDVYEEESGLFFEDFSDNVVDDDVLMRLTTFPNVLLTSHQAFFTREALTEIARVTNQNLDAYEQGQDYQGTEVS
ncbi:2-hydroxyacid dehydrogenase [Verrucomicrobiaceae bacterium R5-34]|nr:2-hydroxyacid dehydrogenase [Verrucomicrobiaceae bacterium R5-34]